MRLLSHPEEYGGFIIRLEPDFTVTFSEGLCCWTASSFSDARVRIDLICAERRVLARRAASRPHDGPNPAEPFDLVGSRGGRRRSR
jgi:hypothetical protein